MAQLKALTLASVFYCSLVIVYFRNYSSLKIKLKSSHYDLNMSNNHYTTIVCTVHTVYIMFY